MNLFGVIILTTLLLGLVLNLIADFLNLTRAKAAPPEGFEGVYDPRRYTRSQAYLRANTLFGWWVSGVDLAVVLIFWFTGGFGMLDRWVRALDFGPVVGGILFIGALMLLKTLIGLPFSLYSTFVIEERFGFNKTDLRTFILDRVKGFCLAVVIGVPLLAAILGFFQYAGENAWWYCWLIFIAFALVIQFVAPTWIMPLFNKFEPIEEGELRSAVMAYARRIDYPLAQLFVMDGSKRSAKGNAFFTGFGKNKRIALFDTLIAQHTVGELVAVLAHEIGHYKKKHILKGMVIGMLHAGVMFFLLSQFISNQALFDAFYVANPSVYAGLIFFSLLFAPVDLVLGIFLQMISRRNEYEADRFAVETTKDPRAMADALKKLSANNLSNLTPHPFYVFLHYSHPPVAERVRAIHAAGGGAG